MDFPLVLSLKKQKNFYASRVKILSPAKINLYLNILQRGSDGFHRIESIVERVSLFDEISIEVKKDPLINVFCDYAAIATSDNLCYKAAVLLKEKFNFPFGFDIHLKKNIPLGAGLGGGSSNAASTFLAINLLLNLRLTQKDLYSLGSMIGSDVNFFLSQNRFAFIWGKGEKVKPLKGKRLKHLIIWPQINLSTKRVYGNLRLGLTKYFNNVKILNYALKKGDIFLLKKNIFNALEKSAFSLSKELRKIKEHLNREGLSFWLTGSGSAFYTFLDKKLRKSSFSNKWRTFKVQTF